MADAIRKVKRSLLAAGLVALGLTVATASSVGATHNTPEISVSEGDCGEVTLSASWTSDTHQAADAVLVVQTVEGQQTASIGESITVGPFAYESDTIRYRVWGGGERAYDVPVLSDPEALQAYLAGEGRTPLDISAPGTAWHTLEVEGCPESTEVSSIEPEVTLFDCAENSYYPGTITVPDVEGLSYETVGATRSLEPGTYTAAVGLHTLVARPDPGYVLDSGEESVVYEIVMASVEACPDGIQPAGEQATSGELAGTGAPPATAVPGEPNYTG